MADEDKTVVIDEGVTVSPPDTQDVPVEAETEPQSMAEAVIAEMEGAASDPGTEEVAGTEEAETPDPEPTTEDEVPPDAQAEAAGTEETDGTVPDGDPTEEELKNYSQKANTRIRDLVDQRNTAAQRADRVEPIMAFLEKNDIPQQDLDVILDLTARLRHGDFAGFLQGITPYVDLANQYTGKALPADLEQQVQQGYVSPEIATELSKARAENQMQQGNAQQRQNSDRQQIAQMRGENIRSAVGTWERNVKQNDPDYDLKADVVRRTSQALMQEHGTPQTPEQAVELAQAAYDEVNGQMKKLRPAPKATSRNPASTGQQGGSAPTAEPTSMMEAAMQGLNAARG
jgi:hypothetical protein